MHHIGNAAGPSRYPFIPHLLINKNASLCEKTLDVTIKDFKAESGLRKETEVLKWEELKLPVEITAYDAGDHFRLAYAHIDRTDKIYPLVNWEKTRGWRFESYAYIFPSQDAFDEALKTRKTLDEFLKKGKRYYPPETININSYQIKFSTLTFISPFEYGKELFFYNELPYNHDKRALVQVLNTGAVELVCLIQTEPTKEQVEQFESLPVLSDYITVLKNMRGVNTGSCGTMHSDVNNAMQGNATIVSAGFNPWTFNKNYNVAFSKTVRNMLEDWRYFGIWNYKQYNKFLSLIEPSKEKLAEYYISVFGMDVTQARSLANKIIYSMADFQFWPEYYYGLSDYDPQKRAQYNQLARALLTGENEERVLSIIKGNKNNISSDLPNAIEHPNLLRLLLDNGADPDYQNEFGKTALMYAAQMNALDAARILLENEADVTLVTKKMGGCGYAVSTANRSALTYAAENASEEFITLLINAGADSCILDSNKNDLRLYLAKNMLLNEKQTQAIALLLTCKHH